MASTAGPEHQAEAFCVVCVEEWQRLITFTAHTEELKSAVLPAVCRNSAQRNGGEKTQEAILCPEGFVLSQKLEKNWWLSSLFASNLNKKGSCLSMYPALPYLLLCYWFLLSRILIERWTNSAQLRQLCNPNKWSPKFSFHSFVYVFVLCHSACMEVRRQLLGISFLRPYWVEDGLELLMSLLSTTWMWLYSSSCPQLSSNLLSVDLTVFSPWWFYGAFSKCGASEVLRTEGGCHWALVVWWISVGSPAPHWLLAFIFLRPFLCNWRICFSMISAICFVKLGAKLLYCSLLNA